MSDEQNNAMTGNVGETVNCIPATEIIPEDSGRSNRKRVSRHLAAALNGCLCGMMLNGSSSVSKGNQGRLCRTFRGELTKKSFGTLDKVIPFNVDGSIPKIDDIWVYHSILIRRVRFCANVVCDMSVSGRRSR